MRVIVATPLYPPEIGGPATYARILEDEFLSRNIEVVVIKFSDVRHYPKAVRHLWYAARVLRAVRKADIVLALDPVSVGLPVSMACRAAGKPYVVKVVGDYAWEQGRQRFGVSDHLDDFLKRDPSSGTFPVRALQRIQSSVARNASRIIVPSEYLAGVIRTWGVLPERIAVVPNAFHPIDAPEMKRDELQKQFDIPGRYVLSAGRLAPWKGFETLINLFPAIRNRFPDATLLIAGSGVEESRLRLAIAKTGQTGIVRLLGAIPRERLLPLVAHADCFVLNTGYEGLSHQLIEVMSLGAPIVTTRVGGNPELIEDGVSGTLVAHDDVPALTEGIARMLSDDEYAKRCREAAKRKVASFSIANMLEGTITALEIAVDGVEEDVDL